MRDWLFSQVQRPSSPGGGSDTRVVRSADAHLPRDAQPDPPPVHTGRPRRPRRARYRPAGDAIERETGAFLGWFHLRPRSEDPADEPELGYRFTQLAWGKGSGTEGSRALIDKAFADLGAQRVHASTMNVDRGSWRVMEKAGMRFVRPFFGEWPERIPGDEAGDVEYAITREEWEADRAAGR